MATTKPAQDSTTQEASEEKAKQVYIDVPATFVYERMGKDLQTGEPATFYSVTIPKGTVGKIVDVDGVRKDNVDLANFTFTSRYANDSKYHEGMICVSPGTVGYEKTLTRGLGEKNDKGEWIPQTAKDGKPLFEEVKIDVSDLKDALVAQNKAYIAEKEKNRARIAVPDSFAKEIPYQDKETGEDKVFYQVDMPEGTLINVPGSKDPVDVSHFSMTASYKSEVSTSTMAVFDFKNDWEVTLKKDQGHYNDAHEWQKNMVEYKVPAQNVATALDDARKAYSAAATEAPKKVAQKSVSERKSNLKQTATKAPKAKTQGK